MKQNIIIAATMVLAFTLPRGADAINIVLDYTLDANNENWFGGTPEGLARRASVDAAADFLSAIITTDDWNAIAIPNKDIFFSDIAASSLNDMDGNPVAGDPESDGAGFDYNFDVTNRSSVGANEYVIYVGAFQFDAGASSHAKAGWDSTDNRNGVFNEFSTWGGKMYFDSGESWYADSNPGLNPSDNYGFQDPDKTPPTDITTDNWDWNTSTQVWKGFDLETIDPTANGKFDLYATTLHEMIHALGATNSNMSTYVGVSGGNLIGTNVVAEFGGPVPKSSTTGHFANDVQSEVWNSDGIISEVTLDPNSLRATRKYLTKLDAALLRDLGYNVLQNLSPADFNVDTQVDGADLALWEADFGINSFVDANGDFIADGADFLIWQREFGDGVPPVTASVVVPEPTSLLLLAAMLATEICSRRRRIF